MGLLAKIASLRGVLGGLSEGEVDPDPFRQFDRWFAFAKRVVFMPNAMTLATATPDGIPSARMMLLKGAGPSGFVFYTNYQSRKGRELAANPRAAIIVHWVELQRQVRAEGAVERMTAEESLRYFHSRPRGSQIGAWASHQSEVLPSRAAFDEACRKYDAEFAGRPVPLPPYWGGFCLRPHTIEFWQGRVHRLHDRIVFQRQGEGWIRHRLSP
jgi:pyridoxamine 5'-phosphate oxidase